MSAILSAPVLALNRHFAPLRVLNARRAVGMVFTRAPPKSSTPRTPTSRRMTLPPGAKLSAA